MKTNSVNKVRKSLTMTLMALLAVALLNCHNKNTKQGDDEVANMHNQLKENECDTVVCSDDGVMCCYGHFQSNRSEIPYMTIQYTVNGETHWVEEMGSGEDCHLCLTPESIYHVGDKNSTIYLVYGYGGYSGNGTTWCLKAYRLEDGILQPASVFEGFKNEESICIEIPSGKEDLRDEIFYYNKEDSTIYINNYGCSKYLWNGERFVPEGAFGGIVKRHINKDNKDFELMYDVGTTHPWSCYVTEDSSTVLKLEKVHSDLYGDSYRVLIFEPVYWHNGMHRFPELGSEPTYVGYGTNYEPHPDYIDFSFISGYTDSDESIFVLSGHRSNWDSVLVGNFRPPIYSFEEIKECVFRKQSWEDILSWWSTKQW